MKVAFVTARTPYPPNTGGRIRTFNLLRQISQRQDVTLITAVEGQEDEAALAAFRKAIPALTVRAVKVTPRTAPLRRAGRVARSPIDPLPYTWGGYRDHRFTANLQAALEGGKFDILHCDNIQVGHALFGLTTPPRLLNAHNVESVIVRRLAEHESSSWRKALITWQYRKTLRAEVRAHRFFHRSVVVSDVDRAEFERISPGLSISVVPNGVDLDCLDQAWGTPAYNTIAFVGSMDWLPNLDGVNFFLREVFPRIKRQVPSVKFWVVGRNPPPSLIPHCGTDGIRITGTVDDVRPYIARASVVVVPLRIGGGTRLKILEAWAMRKAVVSTSIGAEGLPAVDRENLLLADTPEDMAVRVVALLNDPSGAARLGAAGRRMVEEHFAWKQISGRLLEAYDETVEVARWRQSSTPHRRAKNY